MRLIRGLTNLKTLSQSGEGPLARGCVATVGNFDGVHRGHQAILEQVKTQAAKHNLPSVVVIFEPQPQEFFRGVDAPPRLTGFRQKVEALRAQGIDAVLCLRFDEQFRQFSAWGFVDSLLIQGLAVKHLVVGDDFRFGCDRSGDFNFLEKVGADAGFTVENTRTVVIEGDRVSSTRIRKLLADNQLDSAEHLLGWKYHINGRIVYGRQLGREIGAPTANIRLAQMPALQGVYVVKVKLADGTLHDGIANIGLRPTVDGKHPALEVHLFDYAGTLYGQRLDVTFRQGLRDEVRFESVGALKTQIAKDFSSARHWLAESLAANRTAKKD